MPHKRLFALFILLLSFSSCTAMGHLADFNALNHAAISEKYSECVTETCLNQALQALDTPSNADSLELAYVENKLANLYLNKMKRYKDAERLYESALKIRLEKLGELNSKVANVYMNLGTAKEDLGLHSDAQQYLVKAVEIHKKLDLGASTDRALALSALGEFYCHNGHQIQGEQLLTESLKMYDELGVPDLANLYHNTAAIFMGDGNYKAAETYFSKALQLRIDGQGADHPDVAMELGQLANIEELLGNYKKAYSSYQQAIKINRNMAESGEVQLGYAGNLFGLSRLSPKVGKPEEEEPLLKTAIEESWKLAQYDDKDAASGFYGQLSDYLESNDLKKANRISEEMLKLFDQSDNKAMLLDSMYGIACQYFQKKQLSQTEKYCQKLLAYFQSNQTDYVTYYPDILSLLGQSAEQKQDYKAAVAWDEKSYELRVKLQGKENEHAVATLAALALDYLRTNDLQKASNSFDQAIAYYKKRLNPELAETLEKEGAAFRQQGQYDKSRLCYEKALALQEAIYGKTHAITANAHWGLAYSLGKQGKVALAEPHYQTAFNIYQKTNPSMAQTITKEFNKIKIRG